MQSRVSWIVATRLRSKVVFRLHDRWRRTDSRALSNITYSGGQAISGQGGFYGSGGARSLQVDNDEQHSTEDKRHRMLALAADVENLSRVVAEAEALEQKLLDEDDVVSSKSIELKASIKKLMTDPSMLESLNRLEVQGQPVWGLSSQEREMVALCRYKVNNC